MSAVGGGVWRPETLVLHEDIADLVERLVAVKWGELSVVEREQVRDVAERNGWDLEEFIAGSIVSALLTEYVELLPAPDGTVWPRPDRPNLGLVQS